MPISTPPNDPARIYSFAPLINRATRILILGTVPSVISLEEEMYYAHERNHFWDFMYRILDPDFTEDRDIQLIGKKDRYQLLLDNRVGLWDIIHSCERKGSNDSKIVDPKYNNLAVLLSKNTQAIFCNGGEVYKHLKKSEQLKTIRIPIYVLGSTSSLNPNNTFRTLRDWKQAVTANFKHII